jgi:prepilin-type N-terminal cleavage/methylation domain-containing protein
MIRRSSKAVARSAFTLMEMMVVVAIIVVMVGAAVPIYFNSLENSKRDRVKMDIKTLEDTAARYNMRQGHFPESLQVLTQPDDSGIPPLDPKSVVDPWGQQYVYNASDINPTTQVPYVYSQKTGKDWRP